MSAEGPTTMNLSGYKATRELLATQYTRGGGRRIFVIALPLHLIPSHLPKPDPDRPFPGNRRVDIRHARNFGRYWSENLNWMSPPLLTDTNTSLKFRPEYEEAGVSVGVLELSHGTVNTIEILDGQHRILGWYLEIEKIAEELREARRELLEAERGADPSVQELKERVSHLESLEERLSTEYVTIELAENLSLQEHKQAFADITANAKGITRSKAVDFDSVSVLHRVTRELADEEHPHPLLSGRVDFERDRIAKSNPNLLSAINVADIVRHVCLGIAGRMTTHREKNFDDEQVFDLATQFFDTLTECFSDLAEIADEDAETRPPELRQRSLLGSPTILRVLAGVFHNLAVRLEEDVPRLDPQGLEQAQEFFAKLAPHMSAPVYPATPWHETGYFPEDEQGVMAPSSRAQDLKGLTNLMTKWATGQERMPF